MCTALCDAQTRCRADVYAMCVRDPYCSDANGVHTEQQVIHHLLHESSSSITTTAFFFLRINQLQSSATVASNRDPEPCTYIYKV